MIVYCNCCGKKFNENDLPLLVKYGNVTERISPTKSYGEECEVFHGCPLCFTDEFLMDMDEE